MSRLLLKLFLLSASGAALAFDVDGFQDGMSKLDVKDMLTKLNFNGIIDYTNDTLMARDLPPKGTGRSYTFNFCKDRLVSIQKDYPPSMEHFILLADNLKRDFGEVVSIYPQSNQLQSFGKTHSISLYWRDKRRLVELRYSVFPSNELLSITHDVQNSCYKIPP
ncbi:MAG: hypothetical protein MN733_08345 [Nitrososphaera sp.]|nr:hypothetical protein [Nitrososphaera sp.]